MTSRHFNTGYLCIAWLFRTAMLIDQMRVGNDIPTGYRLFKNM